MLSIVKLILPVIIPSWNFFDVIVASPRIQYCLLRDKNEPDRIWSEFRPRAMKVAFITMLGRLFWNPKWNETLYLVSCAERLVEQQTNHSEDEIFKRVISSLSKTEINSTHKLIKIRLSFIKREGNLLTEEIVYQSPDRMLQN